MLSHMPVPQMPACVLPPAPTELETETVGTATPLKHSAGENPNPAGLDSSRT